MKTKITICIPVYNREKTIEQTLKSVINAKLTNYEILISDNSSTDKTKEICLKIQKKYPHLIKYFENKKNLGFAENYKNCINKAEGEYLFFIGGDDILLPNGINNLILTLDRSPQADIVCSDIYTFSNNPSIIEKKFIFFNGKKRVFQKGSNVLINWLFNSAIGSIGGYLIRSSEAKKYIKFIPSDSLVPQVHLSAYMAIHNNIIHYPIFTFAQRLTESPTQLANKQYLSLHIVKEIFKLFFIFLQSFIIRSSSLFFYNEHRISFMPQNKIQ